MAVEETKQRRLVVLLGGTFDPVHNGHLRAAVEVQQSLAADEVRLVPSRIPPYKPEPTASSAQRLAMLEKAVDELNNGWKSGSVFCLDDRELRRDSFSFTVDTLREFRGELPAETALAWVIGMDGFAQLHSWHHWQQLTDNGHLIVVTRPGQAGPVGEVAQWAQSRYTTAARLRDHPSGGILKLSTTPLAIASSDIRRMIAAGLSPDFLTPKSVVKYIRHHNLYLSTASPSIL